MPWMIGAGISGISSVFGASSSKKAAKAQAAAAESATQLQAEMYNQSRKDLYPYMDTGNLALGKLREGLGLVPGGDGALTKPFGMEDFKESPAYQFNLAQGQKAIDKAAASRGMYNAPATLRDISRFSQGMASNEFQNAYSNYNNNMNNIWSRLFSMSGSGQNASAGMGALAQGAGNSMAQNITGAGNAAAAGQVGAANAISGGVGQGLNFYLMNQLLQKNQAPSTVPLKGIPGMTGDFGDFSGVGGGWAGGVNA